MKLFSWFKKSKKNFEFDFFEFKGYYGIYLFSRETLRGIYKMEVSGDNQKLINGVWGPTLWKFCFHIGQAYTSPIYNSEQEAYDQMMIFKKQVEDFLNDKTLKIVVKDDGKWGDQSKVSA